MPEKLTQEQRDSK